MTLLDAAPQTDVDHASSVPPHHHSWTTESSHATSEGRVHYLRCDGCGIRRVWIHPASPDAEVRTSRDVPPK